MVRRYRAPCHVTGRGSVARRAAALLATLVVAGCYTYVPASGTPAPGSEVRVGLTGELSPAVERVLGRGVAVVEGRVVAQGDSGVVLAVTRSLTRDSIEASWGGEQVLLPPSVVAGVAARRLDRRRTTLFSAAMVALAAVSGVILSQLQGEASGTPPGSGGGGPPPP